MRYFPWRYYTECRRGRCLRYKFALLQYGHPGRLGKRWEHPEFRGKNITEQAVVDGYAADIEAAIKALEKKKDSPKQPADTASPAKPGKTHNSNAP